MLNNVVQGEKIVKEEQNHQREGQGEGQYLRVLTSSKKLLQESRQRMILISG